MFLWPSVQQQSQLCSFIKRKLLLKWWSQTCQTQWHILHLATGFLWPLQITSPNIWQYLPTLEWPLQYGNTAKSTHHNIHTHKHRWTGGRASRQAFISLPVCVCVISYISEGFSKVSDDEDRSPHRIDSNRNNGSEMQRSYNKRPLWYLRQLHMRPRDIQGSWPSNCPTRRFSTIVGFTNRGGSSNRDHE